MNSCEGMKIARSWKITKDELRKRRNDKCELKKHIWNSSCFPIGVILNISLPMLSPTSPSVKLTIVLLSRIIPPRIFFCVCESTSQG